MKSASVQLLTFLVVLIALCAQSACNKSTGKEYDSFTSDKVYSYDEAYYALQKVEQIGAGNMIKVEIYSTDTDEVIADFTPARAMDFWGICWEKDTYNIWVQSGDIGVLCYVFQNEMWVIDENAERPADIISKYD